MTVCIGATCTLEGNHYIVCAADRMLGTYRVQYEPLRTNMFLLGPSTLALTAGTAAVQWELCVHIRQQVEAASNAGTAWDVETIAQQYGRCVVAYRQAQAETRFLAPLGLRAADLLQGGRVDAATTSGLILQLQQSESVDSETIVAGYDRAAHIYQVDGYGTTSCADSVGFVSVGSGKHFADWQFMAAGHTPANSLAETVYLTYVAKKRAEAAPGVGKATDMVLIGPTAPRIKMLEPEVMRQLEQAFRKMEDEQALARTMAQIEIQICLESCAEVPMADEMLQWSDYAPAQWEGLEEFDQAQVDEALRTSGADDSLDDA